LAYDPPLAKSERKYRKALQVMEGLDILFSSKIDYWICNDKPTVPWQVWERVSFRRSLSSSIIMAQIIAQGDDVSIGFQDKF